MSSSRTAVYSTVYPAAAPFLAAWYASLQAQTDRNFDLWVGADRMTAEEVSAAAGCRVDASFVFGVAEDTPASLRRRALLAIVDPYDAVVFIDSDDVACPLRVARSRVQTDKNSVVGCGLSLIDESGADLGTVMRPRTPVDWMAIMPRMNILGLSNTTYGTDVLRHLLEFPDDCTLLDWHLATRAWLRGARLAFDPEPLMSYRQYAGNTANVLGPFTQAGLRRAVSLVLQHFDQLPWHEATTGSEKWMALCESRARVESFSRSIEDDARIDRYLEALNRCGRVMLWWEHVANPSLEATWIT